MAESANRPPPHNHLLASLPVGDYTRLASTFDIILTCPRNPLHG